MSDIPNIISPVDGGEPIKKKGNSLNEGLKIVKQATVEDQKGNIDEAVQLYSLALELFQTAVEETTDEKIKTLIKTKSENYIARMEHLRAIILQDQFPEVPEDTEESEIEDLEKQFADTPVSDNSYNLTKQEIDLSKDEPKRAPPDTPEDDFLESPPSYASPSPPPSRMRPNTDNVESIEVGAENPEVVSAIEEAVKWITLAKEDEEKGQLVKSVASYKKGLSFLFKAYKLETNKQVKELVRVKYNVLVSRVEEVECQLSIPDEGNTKALVTRLGVVEEYTNKARKLADGFDFGGSIKYYNLAMAEINKMMETKEFESSKKWLAKRALVTERRIGGISAVLKVVQVALPYPWSKLFGIVEFGLRVSGVTGKAQGMIDKKLSKIAGVDPNAVPALGDAAAIDIGTPSPSGKKKKKDKKKK